MLSAGVPMITGGDEALRTQFGNNNAYNLDSSANWLFWTREHDRGQPPDLHPAPDRVPQGAPGAAPGELLFAAWTTTAT